MTRCWTKIRWALFLVTVISGGGCVALAEPVDECDFFRHGFHGKVSVVDTWIPIKIGVSYEFRRTGGSTLEVEYSKGALTVPLFITNLGSISEQRFSLYYKASGVRRSFNFTYGITYNSISARLGSDFLNTISGGSVGVYDALSVKTLGINWGFGHRWKVKTRYIVSLDWFMIYLPLHTVMSDAEFLSANASQQKQEQIRDILNYFEKIPQFSIFKIGAGVSF